MATISQTQGTGLYDPASPGAMSIIDFYHSLIHQKRLWVMSHYQGNLIVNASFSVEFRATKETHMTCFVLPAVGTVEMTVKKEVIVTPETGTSKFLRNLHTGSVEVCDFMESYQTPVPTGCKYSVNSTWTGGTELLQIAFNSNQIPPLMEIVCKPNFHYAINCKAIASPPVTATILAYFYRPIGV